MTYQNEEQNSRADNDRVIMGSVSVDGSIDDSQMISSNNVVGCTLGQVSALVIQVSTKFIPKPFDGRCPYKEKLIDDLVSRAKNLEHYSLQVC